MSFSDLIIKFHILFNKYQFYETMFHDILNRGDFMSIMTQLEFELDFSSSEKTIAKYILDNGEDILNLSVKELAKQTYTSPATIVRLCRKLGLNGYGDFKIKYSAELQFDKKNKKRVDVNFPFGNTDSNSQIAYRIANLHQEAIEDTLNLVDFKNLDKIINLLDQARRIYLFGNGNSLLAGFDFQHKMMRIQRNVNFLSLTCLLRMTQSNHNRHACRQGRIHIRHQYTGNSRLAAVGLTAHGSNTSQAHITNVVVSLLR